MVTLIVISISGCSKDTPCVNMKRPLLTIYTLDTTPVTLKYRVVSNIVEIPMTDFKRYRYNYIEHRKAHKANTEVMMQYNTDTKTLNEGIK